MDVELIAVTRYLRGNGTPEELLEHGGESATGARAARSQGGSSGRACAKDTSRSSSDLCRRPERLRRFARVAENQVRGLL